MPSLPAFALAPGRRRRTAARALALTTTQRVIHRVLGDATHARTPAQPAALTRLAHRQKLVLRVADLANGGQTAAVHQSHFGRAKPERDVVAFLRDHLCARAGGARQLAALPDLELHVVDRRAEGDFRQGHRIPAADVGARARHNAVAYCETLRVQDVALLAVGVDHERDPRAPIGIVFDLRHPRRNAELVAFEVDPAIHLLVRAALVASGHVAEVVAPTRPILGLDQRLLRRLPGDLVEAGDRTEASCGCHRPELSDAHLSPRTRRSSRLPSGLRSPSSSAPWCLASFPVPPRAGASAWCERP